MPFLTPRTAEQLFYEALALQQKFAFAEAAAKYQEALLLAPGRLSIQINLAVTLLGLQRYTEAESICTNLLKTNPDDEEVLLIFGPCQSNMGRKQDALATFNHITTINPFCVDAWNGRGNVLHDLKQLDSALESLDHALGLAPDYPEALNNRGNVLLDLNRSRDALDSYDRALRARPDYAMAHNNRGNALLALNQTRMAMESFNKACQIQPDYTRAHWNESLCRLALGDFALGWEKYEWGWIDGQRGPKLDLGKPWWDGADVNGTLLAWGAQGVGDQILFSSMLPELARHAKSLRVAVDSRLVELFQRSFPEFSISARDDQLQHLEFDAHVSLDSLGQHLRKSWKDFPEGRNAYLLPDQSRSAKLRNHFMAQKLVCGISWLSRNNAVAESKSLLLKELYPILSLQNIQAIDLQYGDSATEREHLSNELGLYLNPVEEIDKFNDIDGLAALISACDVVVTVSNTTAHLAGALGKQTFLMLPYSTGRHWYWHDGIERSPWYPSIRVFRQSAPGDWSGVIAQIKTILSRPC